MQRVLWVIAGRGKTAKIGKNIEIHEEEHIFNLKALDDKFADEFLINVGIEAENLREGLVKLTGGYPIFLSLCADMYKSAIRKNGVAPSLEKFGDKREDVIKRMLEFMDDGTRNIKLLQRASSTLLTCLITILTTASKNFHSSPRKMKIFWSLTEASEKFCWLT